MNKKNFTSETETENEFKWKEDGQTPKDEHAGD